LAGARAAFRVLGWREGKEMKRLVLLLVVATFALAIAPFGAGAPPRTVEAFGSASVVETFRITFTPAGTNVLKFTASTEWEYVGAPPGALSDGLSSSSLVGTLNCKTGDVRGDGTETYSGGIVPLDPENTVTLTWRYHFSGTGECETPQLLTLEGKGILVEATGEVPGTHGTIEFTDILGGDGFRRYLLTYF
jgi:hypothetical protein